MKICNWSRCLEVISCGEYILGVLCILHVLTHNSSVNEIKGKIMQLPLHSYPQTYIIIVNNILTSTTNGHPRNVLQMYMYIY